MALILQCTVSLWHYGLVFVNGNGQKFKRAYIVHSNIKAYKAKLILHQLTKLMSFTTPL